MSAFDKIGKYFSNKEEKKRKDVHKIVDFQKKVMSSIPPNALKGIEITVSGTKGYSNYLGVSFDVQDYFFWKNKLVSPPMVKIDLKKLREEFIKIISERLQGEVETAEEVEQLMVAIEDMVEELTKDLA